jgi:hypothetical protein
VKAFALALVVSSALAAPVASAFSYVRVTDPTQLQYQTTGDGKIWLRNINIYNSSFQGCCYNYYIDTTTAEGKNIYAMMLAYIAMGRPFTLGFPNDTAGGPVAECGDF